MFCCKVFRYRLGNSMALVGNCQRSEWETKPTKQAGSNISSSRPRWTPGASGFDKQTKKIGKDLALLAVGACCPQESVESRDLTATRSFDGFRWACLFCVPSFYEQCLLLWRVNSCNGRNFLKIWRTLINYICNCNGSATDSVTTNVRDNSKSSCLASFRVFKLDSVKFDYVIFPAVMEELIQQPILLPVDRDFSLALQ